MKNEEKPREIKRKMMNERKWKKEERKEGTKMK